MTPLPIVVLATTRPADRDAAVLTALLDAPDALAVVHDLGRPGAPFQDGTATDPEDVDGAASLRRRVLSAAGVVEDREVMLDHACPGCALREDAVPAIAEAVARGAGAILLALPLGAEILPATRTLLAQLGPDGDLSPARLGVEARLGATVTVCDRGTVVEQLMDGGDDLVAHLVGADVVVLTGEQDARADEATDALRWLASQRFDDVCEPWFAVARVLEHDDLALERRCDPATLEPGYVGPHASRAADGALTWPSGIWRLDLRNDRAFHPERLLELLHHLAPEHVVSRGRFWVPSRPDACCGWESVCGQVCIGVAGPWEADARETRLVVVGLGPGRSRLRRAFVDALLTEAEVRLGGAAWLGRRDPLRPYLGDPAELHRTAEDVA